MHTGKPIDEGLRERFIMKGENLKLAMEKKPLEGFGVCFSAPCILPTGILSLLLKHFPHIPRKENPIEIPVERR